MVVLSPVSLRRQIVTGELEEASALVHRAVDAGRDDALVHELLTAIALKAGRQADAARHVAEALARDADWLQAHVLAIKLFSQTNELGRAVEHARRALELGPTSTEVLSASAKIFEKSGRHGDAAKLWQRLAAARPHDLNARSRAIACFDRCGMLDEAVTEAREACAANPASHELHLRFCDVAIRAAAADAIQHAILKLARLDAAAALDRVGDLALGGFYPEAMWLITHAAEAGHALDAQVAFALARHVEAKAERAEVLEQYADALAAWRLICVLLPESPRGERVEQAGAAALKHAAALQKAGGIDSARQIAVRVAAIWPTARALTLAAALASACDDHDAAMMTYVELATRTEDAARRDAIGRALRSAGQSGDPIRAVAVLRRLETDFPDVPDIETMLASLRDKLLSRAKRLADAGEIAAAHDAWTELATSGLDEEKLASLGRRLVKHDSAAMRQARLAGDQGAAMLAAERLLAIDPDRVDALKFLGALHLKGSRFEPAAAMFERLRLLEPDVPKHLYQLGRAYRSLGRYEDGIAVLLEYLESEQDDVAGKDLLNEIIYRHAG